MKILMQRYRPALSVLLHVYRAMLHYSQVFQFIGLFPGVMCVIKKKKGRDKDPALVKNSISWKKP